MTYDTHLRTTLLKQQNSVKKISTFAMICILRYLYGYLALYTFAVVLT